MGWRLAVLLFAVAIVAPAMNSTPATAQAGSPSVVMVVGDPAAVAAGDAAVRDRLESLGFSVSVVDDNGVSSSAAAGSSFVLISSTVSSWAVGSTFRDVAEPVWVAKPWSLDDMALTGPVPDTDYGTVRSDSVILVDAAHPAAAGLSGTVTITPSPKTMSFGEPGGDATIVSTAAGRPSTYVYEAGTQLADGSTAAGCRVHSSIFKSAPTSFTAQGWQLFDALATYAGDGCVEDPGGPTGGPYAVIVSVDGLRADTVAALGPTELPNLYRLIDEGASTLNARTMFDATQTLPNHTSMMTGLPVLGVDGHQVTFNEDDGGTVHDTAGRYVPGMFDVAHDAGLGTALFAGKPKFDFLDRSWDAVNGAADVSGADDGSDKIDVYQRNGGAATTASFLASMNSASFDLSFVHYAEPDAAGHANGWTSPEYNAAVRDVDGYVGQILGMVEGDPDLNGMTHVIVTSDHGGTGVSHGDPALLGNATVPFFVWGPDVTAGSDLYSLNTTTRLDPGLSIPGHGATGQPIRNGDAANLALDLLDLAAVSGSVINASQDLAVDGAPVLDDPPTVELTSPADGATVSGVVNVAATASDDVAVASVEFLIGGVTIGTDVDGSDGWAQSWDTSAGSDGPTTVAAVATDSLGQTASSQVSVTVDNGAPPFVVMVVSNPASLTTGDSAVYGHLAGAGYNVQLLDDGVATAADANGAAFVFVASSIHSYTLGDTFADVAGPVWVAKPWLLDDMNMTGPAGGIDYGTVRSSTITIVDSGHPLSAGLNGDVAVNAGGRTMSFGVPGGSGLIVSTAAGSPSTMVYESGGVLADGSTAPGCRIHASVFNTAVLGWTADAWSLFDAAAGYAASNCGA
ncbi:MAG: hypothetical protein GY722_21570 [bacterium]|nr:hypothetical protein [bacterium]